MDVVVTYLLHFFFFSVLVILFVWLNARLHVFKKHHKRPVSTIALKLTYMLYLAALFVNLYALLFFMEYRLDGGRIVLSVNAFLIVVMVLVPHLTVYFRRRIINNRVLYNYLFAFYNLIAYVVLLYVFMTTKWIVPL